MGSRDIGEYQLTSLPFCPSQVDCPGLWLAVALDSWMAPEPAPGRTMVPLVPALVMLGLVAGAHGDSKSDPLRCGISQVIRWCPS